MREPHWEMSDYAFMTVELGGHSQRTLMEAGWRAMIDAILSSEALGRAPRTLDASATDSERSDARTQPKGEP